MKTLQKIMKYFYLSMAILSFCLIIYQANNIIHGGNAENILWFIVDVALSVYWGYQYSKA